MSESLQQLWAFFVDHRSEIAEQTLEHLKLTLIALALATLVGVTIGIVITRYRKASGNVLGAVGAIQTIPSIALLGFLLPLLGIGAIPAIVALFLYALLPIVRNTFAGIDGVSPAVKEAAKGLGMPDSQVLFKIELPLAVPIIFAGIRTATVTTVGVATLCALIASGGLGEFIFRGIALNNVDMLLAGAIPAAILALSLDFLLGRVEANIQNWFKPILIGAIVLFLVAILSAVYPLFFGPEFRAGFVAEFMERADGYPGLREHYNLKKLDILELDPGLMYRALAEEKVDVISGFSTDGRIEAYNLTVLEDDQKYFPPYYAAPLVRRQTLETHPEIRSALNKMAGQISDQVMADLNYQVDQQQRPTAQVAKEFLDQLGLDTAVERSGTPDILIGSKNFTEQFILSDMMAILIENYTNLDVDLKAGLAGTKIAFDALSQGEIDLYPEYTGTALLAVLKPDDAKRDAIISDKDQVFDYVQQEMQQQYNLEWLEPFGFNNTYALMMRSDEVEELNIRSISDLKNYLDQSE
ncbi:MAG: ABC transporter permease/substrate-binding protein [Microcoleaceae cyanobacterium]